MLVVMEDAFSAIVTDSFCGWRSQHPHAFFILAELSATTGIWKIPKIIFSNNMTQY